VTEPDPAVRPISKNRRARHEYLILEELECGVELKGTEVKSLRAGQGSIVESYGHFRRGELYLVGAHIPVYAHGNVHNHDPRRERKLLAHRRELRQWDRKVREKGVTLVPLEMYFRGSKVKVTIALARGKKMYDKRQAKRAKDDQRSIERAMMRRR